MAYLPQVLTKQREDQATKIIAKILSGKHDSILSAMNCHKDNYNYQLISMCLRGIYHNKVKCSKELKDLVVKMFDGDYLKVNFINHKFNRTGNVNKKHSYSKESFDSQVKQTIRDDLFFKLKNYFKANDNITLCTLPGEEFSLNNKNLLENKWLQHFPNADILMYEYDRIVFDKLSAKIDGTRNTTKMIEDGKVVEVIKNERIFLKFGNINESIEAVDAYWLDYCGPITKEVVTFLRSIKNTSKFVAVTFSPRNTEGNSFVQQANVLKNIFNEWDIVTDVRYISNRSPMWLIAFTK